MFAKDQTSKVTYGELQILYMFTDKKYMLMKGAQKKDRCSILHTPLLRHFEIDLSSYTSNDTLEFIDVPYLINCQILRDENTYSFQDKEGNMLFCTLPQPSITSLEVFENIRFLPGSEFLCSDPRALLGYF
ncbi:hypothetical protein F2Q70_00026198 [Brassica cretica]|uniref:Arabidopsis retrotransposon Orf1 C-terminal domain-containing protein n=1 Tax=Brassica cretica TaxID=69181 RepID=A0A8S9LHZ7_BRACR|nr:hypothetical protein F2Q70_00026198 [Brassica cretica]